MIVVAHDVVHTQSGGCWLCVQCRFTAIYFRGWGSGQGIRLKLGAPVHDPLSGYWCVRWGIGRWSFDVPRLFSIGSWG